MAKPQMVKCRYCKKEIDKSLAYKPHDSARTYYCNKECYDLAQKKKEPKPKIAKKPKEKDSGRYKPVIGSEKRNLTDYIVRMYEKAGFNKRYINWAILGVQIKNFVEKDKFTYEGIRFTLWYMQNIERVKMFEVEYGNNPLCLVPSYYRKMEKYKMQLNKVRQKVKEFEFEDNVNVVNRDSELRLDKIDLEEIE